MKGLSSVGGFTATHNSREERFITIDVPSDSVGAIRFQGTMFPAPLPVVISSDMSEARVASVTKNLEEQGWKVDANQDGPGWFILVAKLPQA
jgi:hypothetical protein